MFKRVLIANRGEIALRIMRACRELGIETVCVYSTADKDAPYLKHADEAICIGPGPSKDSYLNIARIISAAEVSNADAIHPGYGFLSERADFSQICRECEIEFIGPSPEAMGKLGDKVEAKRYAKKAGVPVFPGSEGAIEELDEAIEVAKEIGYPVIIKAAAGGGGRGMRICRTEEDLRENVSKAQIEAQAAFGNGAVFIEKFLEHARHVEVQVLGAKHGNAVHLAERDCSMQRRHQKVTPVLRGGRQHFHVMQLLPIAAELQLVLGQVQFLLEEAEHGPGVPQGVLRHAGEGGTVGQAATVEHDLDVPVTQHPVGVCQAEHLSDEFLLCLFADSHLLTSFGCFVPCFMWIAVPVFDPVGARSAGD